MDQISKFLILTEFKRDPFKSITVIKDFFSLRYVENSGAVWGIFSHHPNKWIPIGITAFSIIALIVVIYFFLKLECRCAVELTSLSFIIGGAVGNITDRIYQGYVVDFIHLYIKQYQWPTFNIADSFISIGVMILVVAIWRGKCTQF